MKKRCFNEVRPATDRHLIVSWSATIPACIDLLTGTSIIPKMRWMRRRKFSYEHGVPLVDSKDVRVSRPGCIALPRTPAFRLRKSGRNKERPFFKGSSIGSVGHQPLTREISSFRKSIKVSFRRPFKNELPNSRKPIVFPSFFAISRECPLSKSGMSFRSRMEPLSRGSIADAGCCKRPLNPFSEKCRYLGKSTPEWKRKIDFLPFVSDTHEDTVKRGWFWMRMVWYDVSKIS